ncbi:transposable element tc3 transposase [Trichonephila clavipes]|nr:transposable element tc3 transposase [Trichonephila clavipes]
MQKLKPQDQKTHLEFAYRFLARMEVDDAWPWKFLWSDEAHFYLYGAVNIENCRIWGTSPPNILHQQPLHSDYVTTWCGFTAEFILEPFFFETLTLQGAKRVCNTNPWYSELLQQQVIPALQERQFLQTTIFVQDGATPNIGHQAKGLLSANFGDNRVISRHFPDA